ncbi:unnamed protein product [Malus baccata var. baccata]
MLKSLDRNGLQHLTSLQKLYIGRCDSLNFLPKQGFPASISFLNITRCPSLKKSDVQVGSPRKRGKEKSLGGSKDMNLDASDEQETMKTKQEELMEICNGGRDGAAAVSNKDVNAKAVRKHRKSQGMAREY